MVWFIDSMLRRLGISLCLVMGSFYIYTSEMNRVNLSLCNLRQEQVNQRYLKLVQKAQDSEYFGKSLSRYANSLETNCCLDEDTIDQLRREAGVDI